MPSQFRGLVVLLVVAAGLVVLLRGRSDGTDTGGDCLATPVPDPASLHRVERVGGFVLERGEGAWWLVEDGERAAADGDAVHELLDALGEARCGLRKIEGPAEAFGLAAPTRLRLDGTTGLVDLRVGDATPVHAGATYLGGSGGEVLVVCCGLREAADLPPAAFRRQDPAAGAGPR